jgi:pimeloyl-ACP methyl ester carboxylesterase
MRGKEMSKNQKTSRPSPFGLLFQLGLAAVGGWIAYSRFAVNHEMSLPKALDADQKRFRSEKAGFLSYYVDTSGEGTPVVLIHSVNAAASAYEMSPIFEYYRGQRPLYALDLPGFGFSERANRIYSPDLYTSAIVDFLSSQVGQAAHVVALSLGAEFAARAANQRPDLFRSLTLISPSGFTAKENRQGSQRASDTGTSSFLHSVFAFPLWSQAFYDLLTSPPSIRYFLQQSFQGEVDQGLADYDYLTAHQPGARFAPLYFISGQLFTPAAVEVLYQNLKMPVLVIYDKDAFVRFDRLPELLTKHLNWRAVRIWPTNGLPQFEKMPEVASALDKFWGEL